MTAKPRDVPCPDCDPHGFDANMEAFYGPPMLMSGPHGDIKIYSDSRVGTGLLGDRLGGPVVEAKSFARAFCPKHGEAAKGKP